MVSWWSPYPRLASKDDARPSPSCFYCTDSQGNNDGKAHHDGQHLSESHLKQTYAVVLFNVDQGCHQRGIFDELDINAGNEEKPGKAKEPKETSTDLYARYRVRELLPIFLSHLSSVIDGVRQGGNFVPKSS